MNRKRLFATVAAMLLISIPGVPSAQASEVGKAAPSGACALQADPQVRQYISAPGAAQ